MVSIGDIIKVLISAALIATSGIFMASLTSAHKEDIPAARVIVIDPEEEEAAYTESGTRKLININTASAEELQTLYGVGEKISAAIVEYRRDTPFEKPEDIMNVSGIGKKKYDAMKDIICV